MSTRSAAAIAAALSMAGCVLHPAPEDVTGATTFQIARQIRCETREAAKQQVLNYIKTIAVYDEDPEAQQLWARYGENQEDISTFRPAMFYDTKARQYAVERAYLNTIYSAAVAYSFDLTMDETDSLGTTTDLLGPWFAKLTVGLTADANRERLNEEVFTLTDTLGGLLENLSVPQDNVPYCGEAQLPQANYLYPIAGRIGVDKTVKTFFDLNTFTGLGSSSGGSPGSSPGSSPATATPAPKSGSSPGSSPASPTPAPKSASPSKAASATGGGNSGNAAATAAIYTEKLTFTTTLDFTATPKLTFTPGGKKIQVADTSITPSFKRIDTHKVYVALAEQPSGVASVAVIQSYLFPAQGVSGTAGIKAPPLVVGNSLMANVRSPGEQYAAQAADQLRSREFQLLPTR
jgi:hypothetical protein